jgi:hypothetical protein
MDFKARLQTLTPMKGAPAPGPAAPARVVTTEPPLSRLVPPVPSAFGPLHLVTQRHAAQAPVLASTMAALALEGELAEVDPTRLLYFDTETTGLAGGTGTLAFLIGTARLEGTEVVVEQVHLPGPGQERAMLSWLSARISEASALVSFNGKSFDWPLLRSRFVMNRLPVPAPRPHLDLLHCARRVYRHRLEEMRLTAFETQVLGVRRVGDIDGALIPAAWFDFLRTGRVATLGRVLEHNARDVLSMVELLQVLAGLFEGAREPEPEVALGCAVVALRLGDDARALQFLSRAVETTAPVVRSLAFEAQGLVYRRQGEPLKAVRAFEAALPNSPRPAQLHVKLAVLFEHRLKDYEAARRHAQLGSSAEDDVTRSRRKARLERRGQLSLET